MRDDNIKATHALHTLVCTASLYTKQQNMNKERNGVSKRGLAR